MTTKLGPEQFHDPRQHLWVGFMRQCERAAREYGLVSRPICITGAAGIRGRRGPLHVHWVGQWSLIQDAHGIAESIQYLKDRGEDIVETHHR